MEGEKEIKKLIELLNEFEGQESWSYDEKYGIHTGWGDDLDYECYIISKKFGFIQWLVENDKIELGAYDYDGYHMNVYDYKDMLMLLSIQDQPIQYLCELLK